MDIYSSLLTTLLSSVLILPTLAATTPSATPSDYNAPIVQNTKTNNLAASTIQARVNINTADAETLAQELKGIGPKRAQAIIAYREAHGPFKSVDELVNVKGISKRIIDQNRDRITI